MTPLRLVLALALAACSAPQRVVDDGTALPLGLTNRASENTGLLSLPCLAKTAGATTSSAARRIEPGTTRSVRVPRGFRNPRTENCQHELMGVMRSARITRATTLVVQ